MTNLLLLLALLCAAVTACPAPGSVSEPVAPTPALLPDPPPPKIAQGIEVRLERDEQPVAGVEVVLRRISREESREWFRSRLGDRAAGFGDEPPALPAAERLERRATSDADGRARFEALPPGSWRAEAAQADALARAVRTIEATGAVELRLPLRAVVPHEGRVVDPAGTPVAGARVRVATAQLGRLEAVTGADGRFSLLAPKNARAFGAHADGFGEGRATRPMGGKAPPLELKLTPARTLRGKLRGSPKGATERLVVVDEGFRTVEAAPDGSFEVRGLPARRVNVVGLADGWSSTVVAVELGFAEPKPLELPLRAPGSIELRVEDETGAPLPGAKLLVGGLRSQGWTEVVTDASGRQVLARLPAHEHTISVVDDELTDVSLKVAVESGIAATATLVVRRGVTAEVEVKQPDGTPVKDRTEVRLKNAAGELAIRGTEAGVARFPRLAPGAWRASVVVCVIDEAGVALEAPGPRVTLVVPACLPLIGRVRRADGSPEPHARLFATQLDAPTHVRRGQAEEDGSFRWPEAAQGRWSIRAEASDGRTAPAVEATAGGAAAELTLPTPAPEPEEEEIPAGWGSGKDYIRR